MSLTFSEFDWPSDLKEQRSLFRACFPENLGLPPETEAFYHRKFHALPGPPASYEYLARDDQGAAGYYAALPFPYVIGDQVLRGGMVCDVMTAPRLRGRGVFTKLGAYSLGKLQEAGVDFVTGYPRRPEVVPGHLKVGWSIAFRLPMYLLPLSLKSLLRSKKLGFLAPVADACVSAWQFVSGTMSRPSSELVAEALSPDEFFRKGDYASFYERWKTNKGSVLLKTEAFLRWRFAVRPEVEYRIIAVRNGGELVGVSVVRSCDPDGIPSLGILDVMCVGDERLVLRSLRAAWIRLAQEWHREFVIMMLSAFHARRVRLWRLGFLRSPVNFDFIIKRLSVRASGMVPLSPDQWHLMWIDSDDL